MLLSVIVLTNNSRELTLSLLDSLAPWLRNNPDSELIIIDNASTDNTLEAVREKQNLPQDQVITISNDKNLGVAPARNIGLRKAKGDYILILDNDTEVTPEAIDAMLDHLRANPGCGLCAPALYSPDGELQDSAKPFPGLGIKIRHLLNLKRLSASEKEAMDSCHPFYVIGACQMFSRQLMTEIGYLDDKIFYGPEDADWCSRIAAAGYSIDYLPDARIIHHWQRATRRSPWSRQALRHFLSLLYFYHKHNRIF